ncbi:hypothetical protein YGH009_03670 [Helicobacter pylori]
MIQIHHADAFEIIKDFYQQNLKVDAIITDPPYNISVKNHFSTLKSAKRQGIDFGEWDKNFRLLEWIKRYAPPSQSKRLHGYFLLLQVYKLYR